MTAAWTKIGGHGVMGCSGIAACARCAAATVRSQYLPWKNQQAQNDHEPHGMYAHSHGYHPAIPTLIPRATPSGYARVFLLRRPPGAAVTAHTCR